MPPFSVEEATLQAQTPLGQQSAPAIVVAALFFCFLVAAVANFLYTKYSFYDVVIISAAREYRPAFVSAASREGAGRSQQLLLCMCSESCRHSHKSRVPDAR